MLYPYDKTVIYAYRYLRANKIPKFVIYIIFDFINCAKYLCFRIQIPLTYSRYILFESACKQKNYKYIDILSKYIDEKKQKELYIENWIVSKLDFSMSDTCEFLEKKIIAAISNDDFEKFNKSYLHLMQLDEDYYIDFKVKECRFNLNTVVNYLKVFDNETIIPIKAKKLTKETLNYNSLDYLYQNMPDYSSLIKIIIKFDLLDKYPLNNLCEHYMYIVKYNKETLFNLIKDELAVLRIYNLDVFIKSNKYIYVNWIIHYMQNKNKLYEILPLLAETNIDVYKYITRNKDKRQSYNFLINNRVPPAITDQFNIEHTDINYCLRFDIYNNYIIENLKYENILYAARCGYKCIGLYNYYYSNKLITDKRTAGHLLEISECMLFEFNIDELGIIWFVKKCIKYNRFKILERYLPAIENKQIISELLKIFEEGLLYEHKSLFN